MNNTVSGNPDLPSLLQRIHEIFSRHKTLTLVSSSPEGELWAGKVYFGSQAGDLYVALEQGRNYRNILKNPRVFFVIEHGVPDLFLQGEGMAERLGPVEEREERHIIFRNAFELVPFAQAYPGVEIFRIHPTRLYVSDFRREWQPRAELLITPEVKQKLAGFSQHSRSRLKTFLKATRPFSFTATLFPVLLGTLLAPSPSLGLFLLTLLSALLLHAGVNVLSDSFDYKKGADTWKVLGSSRVLVDKEMDPRVHQLFGWILAGSGSLLGLILTYLTGPALFLFGVAGIFLGIGYAGPPGLKYRGLGDLAVFLAFGPLMVLGAYYVQTRSVSMEPALLSIPLGLLTIAILHGNNYRDLRVDAEAGYQTFAGFLGEQASSWYYLFLVLSAYLIQGIFVSLGWLSPVTLLTLLSLPLALRNIRTALNPRRVAFTFLDLLTAQLHLVYGLFFTLGVILGRFT